MSEFFAMGGYAVWVWTSWGVSLLAILGLTGFAFLERQRAKARLRELEEDEA